MNTNICNFVPYHTDYPSIHTINFVYETEKKPFDRLRMESVYKMYYVCRGNGILHTRGAETPLSEGDVFFTFPAFPFSIESCDGFAYMYISFLGTRGTILEQRLDITPNHFLFHNCHKVGDFWEKAISYDVSLCDLISESVLLYTFSFIGSSALRNKGGSIKNSGAVSLIKKYIDDNLSDPALSLERISEELNYNKKYISSTFKKHIGLGFSEYLNTIRVRYACTMIEQGYTGISDIAKACGYADAHYFSHVFREKMGIPPKTYIREHRDTHEAPS